jgi:hypothetical protein
MIGVCNTHISASAYGIPEVDSGVFKQDSHDNTGPPQYHCRFQASGPVPEPL